MKKPVNEMTASELAAYVEERKERRLITPRARPVRRTVKALAQAWGVSEKKVIDTVLELFNDRL